MKETGKAFTSRWLKRFGLREFSEESVREHLQQLPLPDARDFELCEFLFCELPKISPKNVSESFAKTAEAYARFVFAFWQSKNAFIPFPQDYAAFLGLGAILLQKVCGKSVPANLRMSEASRLSLEGNDDATEMELGVSRPLPLGPWLLLGALLYCAFGDCFFEKYFPFLASC